MRRREVDPAVVGQEQLFHVEICDAEHEDVVEPLAGLGIDRVRPARPLAAEQFPVDAVRRPAVVDLLRHLRQRERELVEVGHRRHPLQLGTLPWKPLRHRVGLVVRKRGLIGAVAALALIAIPGIASAQPVPRPAPHVRAAHRQAPPIRVFVIHGVTNKYQRTALVKAGYDIGERAWADHVELFGTARQALALTVSGYHVVPERVPTRPGSPIPYDFPPGDSAYHNYAEMVADVQAFAVAHPSLVHIISLGQSFEGRDLIGVRISDDATDNLSEPGVFYVGQHHAREHLTVEVVLNMMHMFIEKPQYSDLVHTRQIYIVPSLNPDGAEWDIHTGQYLFWRKNRQPPDGTDQNRNYSYNWGCCGGSTSDQYGETYRGPNAFSTPEDVAMRDFIEAHPNIHTGISFHSNAELILYPYGYTYTDIPPDMTVADHDTLSRWARRCSQPSATQPCSRPTSTSPTATGTTGCTETKAGSRSRSSSAATASTPGRG